MKWDSQNCYNPYYNPLKELSMKSQNNTDLVQKDDFDSIVMGIMKNFEQNSLPDSISILINFGTEKSHVLYDADQVFHSVAFLCQLQEENSNVSSYTYNSICFYIFPFSIFICIFHYCQANHDCSCHQIWDPFSQMCHDIFCSTGQVNIQIKFNVKQMPQKWDYESQL